MNDHTPGPWKVIVIEDHRFIVGLDGRLVADGRCEGMHAAWLEVSEDDAQLMAAGPELLAACRIGLAALRSLPMEVRASYMDEIETLQAAVAKATNPQASR